MLNVHIKWVDQYISTWRDPHKKNQQLEYSIDSIEAQTLLEVILEVEVRSRSGRSRLGTLLYLNHLFACLQEVYRVLKK